MSPTPADTSAEAAGYVACRLELDARGQAEEARQQVAPTKQ